MAKVVFTGGHHNSALVVANYFKAKAHQVSWIGHRRSSRGDQNDSAEYVEVIESDIPFYDLVAGRATLHPREIFQLPLGLINSLRILIRLKPDFVFTFGGYLGAAVATAAFILKIPVYLHEQTTVAGKANKYVGRFARKIYLTWEQSKIYFPPHKTLVVGLPLRPDLLIAKSKNLFSRRKPTLLIMGGKLGAHIINKFVFDNIHNLLADFNIIHQTGTNSTTQDYEHALFLKDSLGSLSDSYLPHGYISAHDLSIYLRSSDFYFGRSGAHICYELLLFTLRSILVPLNSTHEHEQLKNARILESKEIANIIPQSKLNYQLFITSIRKFKNLKPHTFKVPLDATEKIYNDIF